MGEVLRLVSVSVIVISVDLASALHLNPVENWAIA